MSYITIGAGLDHVAAEQLLSTNFAGTKLEGHPETNTTYITGVVVDLQRQDFVYGQEVLLENNEERTNGVSSVYRYDIDDCTVFIKAGENDGLHIYPPSTSIRTFLADWDNAGDQDFAEFLAEWGYDEPPDEAAKDAKDVRIWCEPSYYTGTLGAPVGHFVKTDDGCDIRVWPTYAEALAWLYDDEESGTYYLAHGEAGRPTYTICE